MDGFRYPQFCPLARAAEVLGQRWVLPLLRELFTGPQRFADLRRRMGGAVSSSVLSDRLQSLEAQGLVERRQLAAPAAASVYVLTARGRALEPALIELVRWGTLLLDAPRPGDHVEPDWLWVALRAFARPGPGPAWRLRLEVLGDDDAWVAIDVACGPEGTRVARVPSPATAAALAALEGAVAPDAAPAPDALLRAPVRSLMGFLSRVLPLEALESDPRVSARGDRAALRGLPELFDMPSPDASAPDGSEPEPKGDPT